MAVYDFYKIGYFGQSNMVGQDGSSGITSVGKYTLLSSASSWIHYAEGKASIIPNFTKKIQEVYPNINIGAVRTSVSAKGFVDTWSDKDSTTYINSKDAFIAVGGVDYLVCFGGEADIAFGESTVSVKDAIELTMSNFRTDLQDPSLQFAYVKPYVGTYSAGQNSAVRDAFDILESEGKLIIIGDAFDYQEYLIDTVHIDRAGMDLLGSESGTTFASTITPSSTIPEDTIGDFIAPDLIYTFNAECERLERLEDENTGKCYIAIGSKATSNITASFDFAAGKGFIKKTSEDIAHYLMSGISVFMETDRPFVEDSGIPELSINSTILLENSSDSCYIYYHSDGSNKILFQTAGGNLYLFLNYGGSNIYASMPIVGNIPLNEMVDVGFSFYGLGAGNSNKVIFYVNAEDKSSIMSFTGEFGTLTPDVSSASNKHYGTEGIKMYKVEIYSSALPQSWFEASLALGPAFGGLLGNYTGEGTMNLVESSFTLSYTAGSKGTIEGNTNQTVDYGTNGSEVTPIPSLGYHFLNWSDFYPTAVRRDLNVTEEISVTAHFEKDPFGEEPRPLSSVASNPAKSNPGNGGLPPRDLNRGHPDGDVVDNSAGANPSPDQSKVYHVGSNLSGMAKAPHLSGLQKY